MGMHRHSNSDNIGDAFAGENPKGAPEDPESDEKGRRGQTGVLSWHNTPVAHTADRNKRHDRATEQIPAHRQRRGAKGTECNGAQKRRTAYPGQRNDRIQQRDTEGSKGNRTGRSKQPHAQYRSTGDKAGTPNRTLHSRGRRRQRRGIADYGDAERGGIPVLLGKRRPRGL